MSSMSEQLLLAVARPVGCRRSNESDVPLLLADRRLCALFFLHEEATHRSGTCTRGGRRPDGLPFQEVSSRGSNLSRYLSSLGTLSKIYPAQ